VSSNGGKEEEWFRRLFRKSQNVLEVSESITRIFGIVSAIYGRYRKVIDHLGGLGRFRIFHGRFKNAKPG
jgi:hypothetical protein